jgi:hypothetical protein
MLQGCVSIIAAWFEHRFQVATKVSMRDSDANLGTHAADEFATNSSCKCRHTRLNFEVRIIDNPRSRVQQLKQLKIAAFKQTSKWFKPRNHEVSGADCTGKQLAFSMVLCVGRMPTRRRLMT